MRIYRKSHTEDAFDLLPSIILILEESVPSLCSASSQHPDRSISPSSNCHSLARSPHPLHLPVIVTTLVTSQASAKQTLICSRRLSLNLRLHLCLAGPLLRLAAPGTEFGCFHACLEEDGISSLVEIFPRDLPCFGRVHILKEVLNVLRFDCTVLVPIKRKIDVRNRT